MHAQAILKDNTSTSPNCENEVNMHISVKKILNQSNAYWSKLQNKNLYNQQ